MMYRALSVFLVVINVGVAAWWALRAPPPREANIAAPDGVPRLQLLQEVPATRRPKAPLQPVTAARVPTQCLSFGPYANPALLRRAHERLQPQVVIARVREIPIGTPRGWRVFVAPLPTREAAQALADRMVAADIDDLLVMPSGPDRNGVALGRFGNEEAARRRQAQLQAAGFASEVAPIGNVSTEGWIDVGATASFDTARAAQDIAAARTQPLDCAALR